MAVSFVTFEDDRAEARRLTLELADTTKTLMVAQLTPAARKRLAAHRNQLHFRLTLIRRRQLKWDQRWLADSSSIRPS